MAVPVCYMGPSSPERATASALQFSVHVCCGQTAGWIKMPLGMGNFEGGKRHPIDSAVICAKTAEAIEMPFGFCARMGPRNHKLNRVQTLHGKGQSWVKGAPIVKYRDYLP